MPHRLGCRGGAAKPAIRLAAPEPGRRGTMRRSACVAGIVVVALILCSAAKSTEWQDSDAWPMYGRNLQHTFHNPDAAITPDNVAQLQSAWVFPTGDAVSASPAVVDGVVY